MGGADERGGGVGRWAGTQSPPEDPHGRLGKKPEPHLFFAKISPADPEGDSGNPVQRLLSALSRRRPGKPDEATPDAPAAPAEPVSDSPATSASSTSLPDILIALPAKLALQWGPPAERLRALLASRDLALPQFRFGGGGAAAPPPLDRKRLSSVQDFFQYTTEEGKGWEGGGGVLRSGIGGLSGPTKLHAVLVLTPFHTRHLAPPRQRMRGCIESSSLHCSPPPPLFLAAGKRFFKELDRDGDGRVKLDDLKVRFCVWGQGPA